MLMSDIDECSLGKPAHNCDHNCVNSDGGFHCTCDEGFLLQNDSRTCEGKENAPNMHFYDLFIANEF